MACKTTAVIVSCVKDDRCMNHSPALPYLQETGFVPLTRQTAHKNLLGVHLSPVRYIGCSTVEI